MDELSSRLLQFAKDNLLAAMCFVVGLILLASGLIAYFGSQGVENEVLYKSLSSGEAGESFDDRKIESKIVIDVSGAVNKPGVYRLPDKSRIEDAIIAAGGVSPGADQEYIAKNVNLASVLSDGAKIYLPFLNQSGPGSDGVLGSGTSQPDSGFLNLNTAGSSELEALPGIGEVTAGKIIDGRPYSTVDELLNRKIVSQKVFEQIKEKVSVW